MRAAMPEWNPQQVRAAGMQLPTFADEGAWYPRRDAWPDAAPPLLDHRVGAGAGRVIDRHGPSRSRDLWDVGHAPDCEHLFERIGAHADRVLLERAEMAAAMHLAYARGATLRSLAAAAGMSHEQVRRIVQERQAELQQRQGAVSHPVTM